MAEAWVMIPRLDKDKTGCVLDMQKLVLCMNCKFGEPCKDGSGKRVIMCDNSDTGNMGWVHEPEWFCADGEGR